MDARKNVKKRNNYQNDVQSANANRYTDFTSAAFFVVLTAVYPLFLWITKYIRLTSSKALFFMLFTVIAAGVVIIILLTATKAFKLNDYFRAGEPTRGVTLPEWLLMGYLLLIFVSALLSRYPQFVWTGYTERDEGVITIACYALTYWIVSRFYKPRSVHFVLFAASGAVISLYAVLQLLGIDILHLFPFDYPSFVDAAKNPLYGGLAAYFRTTLGNVDILSAYSSLAVIFFAALYAGEKTWRGYVYLSASGMAFLMLILSGTDAGKVGILGAMVLMIPYWLSDKTRLGRIMIALAVWAFMYSGYHGYIGALKNSPADVQRPYFDQSFLNNYTPRHISMYIAAGAVLLVLGICLPLLTKRINWPEKLISRLSVALLCLTIIGGLSFVYFEGGRWEGQAKNRVYELSQIMRGNFDDNFGSNRGWVYKQSFKTVWAHPLFGTGPDTFYYALGDELQKEAQQKFNSTFDEAHSSLLQIAVCTGIPALLAYLAFVFGLFGMSLKKAFANPLLLAVFGGALGYFIQSQLGVSVPIVTPIMWGFFGLMAGEVWRMKIEA